MSAHPFDFVQGRPRVSASFHYNERMPFPLFQLVQIVYWLALSTWFGGVLFIAVAAPIIFRTVRENDPTLPTVLSVNLENQHSTLLAGTIVSNLMSMLRRVEVACAAALAASIAAQWAIGLKAGPSFWPAALVRTALFIGCVVLMIYDGWYVWPRIARYRKQYIEHADEPEVANPARDQFDRYQRESLVLLMIVVAMLLGIIMFSSNISGAHLVLLGR